jgi:hypothetical protein
LLVHGNAIVSNGESQVLVAANGVGVFENFHCLKVSQFVIGVKCFVKR